MDLLDRLLEHDHWATALLLDASRGLSEAQLDRPFDIGHGTLRETFEHMNFVVDFWTGAMAGQPVTTAREGHRPIAVLIDRHERSYAAFAGFARRVRDEQRLDDTFVDQSATRKTLGGTIIHVIHHNAQHRGEARHILDRLGVPDLWDGDPQEWETETQDM
jgi:uncharacterized damage-inducible protein DinB